MKPELPKPSQPPQPEPQNNGVVEDAEQRDPAAERREKRASLKARYFTAPSTPGVGVNV